MEITEKITERAKELGALQAKPFATRDMAFDERTLLKCLYGCPAGYHSCPTVETAAAAKLQMDLVRQYQFGVLLETKNGREGQEITLALEREAFLAGYPFAFGASGCEVCPQCTKPEGRPCRCPERKRPTLYALGVDVYKTARNLGWQLKVVQEREDPGRNITALFIA